MNHAHGQTQQGIPVRVLVQPLDVHIWALEHSGSEFTVSEFHWLSGMTPADRTTRALQVTIDHSGK